MMMIFLPDKPLRFYVAGSSKSKNRLAIIHAVHGYQSKILHQ
jgi:hypothetical protein